MSLSPRVRRLIARRGRLWMLGVGATLVIVGAWLAILLESVRARDEAVAQEGAVLSSIALAFAAHVHRTLVGVDEALLAIRRRIAAGDDGFDVARVVDASPALRDIGVALARLDSEGRPVAGSVALGSDAGSLASRPFFFRHREEGDRLVLSEPEISPITHRCDFFASRAIRDAAGRVTGVLVASLRPEYLGALYGRAPLGSDGAIALISDDGTAWARSGRIQGACGRRVSGFPGILTTHRIDHGLLEVPSPVDGTVRIVAFHPVAGRPFRAFAGMALDDVLAPARRAIVRYVVFGVALTLSLSGAAMLVIRDSSRHWRVQRMLRRINLRLARSRRVAEQRRQQLQAAVLHGRDGISIFDAGGRLVLSNFAHRQLLGYPEELVRPGVSAIEHLRFQLRRGDLGPVEDLEAQAQMLFRRFRLDPPLHFERSFPNGRLVRYRRALTPEGDVVTLYTDVTEERRQIAALHAAQRAAQGVAERRSELLGTVGHDIRTPVTGIVGFLDLVQRTKLTPEQRSHLDMAQGSARSLLALLDDILTQAHIDAGQISLRRTECSLDALLGDTVDLFRPAAAQKGGTIAVDCARTLPAQIVTDGVRLRQILANLVANAVRMSPSGMIEITVECAPDGTAGAEFIRFSIADDGPGVAESEKEAIFQPYYQGADATDGQGSGLGLAICRQLVGLFGGSIGVADRAGGGALFWFTVPLEPAAADPRAVDGLRVLVVEDNAANQLLARRLLEHLGHRVAIVGTAAEARRQMAVEQFDLVMLDRRLPDGDGIDILRAIRSGGPRPVVILATAAATDRDRAAAMEAGADRFVTKPFDLETLAEAIAGARWERLR